MSTTRTITMGDRGRLVVPSDLREAQQWGQGTRLLVVETEDGLLLTSRDRALRTVRRQLAGGRSLAEELSHDRRTAAEQENSA